MAGTMAFHEVKGLRLIVYNKDREIYIANARIKWLENAYGNRVKSDSICSEQIIILNKKFNTADLEVLKYKQQYKAEKLKKVAGLTIGIPVSLAVGILTGILIAPYLH